MRKRSIALLASLIFGAGCRASSNDAPPPPPTIPCSSAAIASSMDAFDLADVDVHVETNGDPGLAIVRDDVGKYLGAAWGGAITAIDAPPDFSHRATIWISTSADARSRAHFTASDGYALERVDGANGPTFLVVANDAHDLAYGAYAFLEALGLRFFHPKDEFVPPFGAPRLPHTLDVVAAPAMASRGMQPHTLHPIEWFDAFQIPSDANLADAKRFVDWLVKTGQNHLQWVLVSSIDFDAWKPHAQAIIDYAHARGVTVGAVVQVWGGAALQNNYVLVSDAGKWQSQMDTQLDRLLALDWDVVELSLGEFLSTDPQSVIDWLNHAVEHLAAAKPSLEINVQNHVGNYPALWVQYQGNTVFYYHLPQFADARLGQVVHTLSLFDLYRDWATYAHPDFHLQHDYILQELPSRRVKYFPESAYWISADVDVPLFLPEFIYSRWNDVHTLTAEITAKGLPPLQGHVLFTSGQEWLYWLTDYLTAKMLWRPSAPLSAFVDDYAAAFGDCAPSISRTVQSLVDMQSKYLFDQRLLAYVQGENTTVDLGYLAGLETHPKRIAFEDVYAMAESDKASFEATVVQPLEAMASEMQPLEDDVAARCRGADDAIAPWCDELWDGIAITRLRALHAAHLYRAILAKSRGTDAEGEFTAAQAITDQARAVVARREPHYRFDLSRLVDDYANPSVYSFGYLRTVHTLCFYTRREEEVRYILDNDGTPEGVGLVSVCPD